MALPLSTKMAFWAAVATSFVFAVWPEPTPVDDVAPDKILHILAFATMAGLGNFAFLRLPAFRLGFLLSCYGALIEAVQTIPALNRDAQFSDWVADTAAVAVVLAVLWAVRRMRLAG